jgi:hypothetical protein
MAAKKIPAFAKRDAGWVEETVRIYQSAGFLPRFAAKSTQALVADVVSAFTERFGRPPKWGTPFDNQRILILDEEHVFFRPLLDVDHSPPLRGLYEATLREWAAISFGAFPAKDIREEWSKDGAKLKVHLKLGRNAIELRPRVYQHGQFDLTILRAVDKLLPAKGRRFRLFENRGDEDQTLIICVDARHAGDFERNREWRFYGPKNWAMMKTVFGEREASFEDE